jgi:hypothetical protein
MPERAVDLGKQVFWRALYGSWWSPPPARQGYTVLVPVPGDLPTFLRLALATLEAQDPRGACEVIVLPDRMTPEFGAAFRRCAQRFSWTPLRLITPGAAGRLVERQTSAPSVRHFAQLFPGLRATTTTHVLFHDADLFIQDRSFLARHYAACADHDRACVGVSPVWDPWFAEHGLDHLVGTWELMADMRWLRSFAPHEHRPHDSALDGRPHTFDTTLLPQAVTPAQRVALNEAAEGAFTHFSYVTGWYRIFQAARGPVEDKRFNLLLIRLLLDAFGEPNDVLPSLERFVQGIEDPAVPVTYTGPAPREHYPTFRGRLDEVLAGPTLPRERADRVEESLAPFDAAFGRRAAPPAAAGSSLR